MCLQVLHYFPQGVRKPSTFSFISCRELSSNNLKGAIPSTVTEMTNLQILYCFQVSYLKTSTLFLVGNSGLFLYIS